MLAAQAHRQHHSNMSFSSIIAKATEQRNRWPAPLQLADAKVNLILHNVTIAPNDAIALCNDANAYWPLRRMVDALRIYDYCTPAIRPCVVTNVNYVKDRAGAQFMRRQKALEAAVDSGCHYAHVPLCEGQLPREEIEADAQGCHSLVCRMGRGCMHSHRSCEKQRGDRAIAWSELPPYLKPRTYAHAMLGVRGMNNWTDEAGRICDVRDGSGPKACANSDIGWMGNASTTARDATTRRSASLRTLIALRRRFGSSLLLSTPWFARRAAAAHIAAQAWSEVHIAVHIRRGDLADCPFKPFGWTSFGRCASAVSIP